MKKLLKKSPIVLLVLAPSILFADTSIEAQRYFKCYGLFVEERVPTSDPLWQDVKAGRKSGTDACMELFDRASLDNNGSLRRVNGSYDPVGQRILNTFLTFHKSQLSAPDYGAAIGVNSERFTRDVTDTNESVYHFMYSIFGNGQKFADIVTRNHSLVAKRHSGRSSRVKSILNINNTTNVNLQNIPTLVQGFYKTVRDENGVSQTIPDEAQGGIADLPVDFVETGLLYGFEEDNRSNVLTLDRAVRGNGFSNLDVNQHLGGGAFGTQAYLLGNLGRDGFPNGGTGLYRRWGKHVLEDFLCRSLPALRTKDVIDEVNVNSQIAFRTGVSCMACHSAMDPLSGVARNVRTGWSHNTGNFATRVKFVGSRNPDRARQDFPSERNDGEFHRRPAEGRLYYRSYDGSLVKQEMEGFSALGNAMAETNDLYVCAAKRYYRFLTGIDVSLADIGDINTPSFTTGEVKQRNRVIELGLELKQHQSVRELLRRIIQSSIFINPDKGV